MTRFEYSYVRFLSNQAGCLFTLVERICAFEILQNSVLVVSEKFKPASPPWGLGYFAFFSAAQSDSLVRSDASA